MTGWSSANGGKSLLFVTGWPKPLSAPLVGTFVDVSDGSPASIAFNSRQMLNYPTVAAAQRPPSDAANTFGGLLVVPLQQGGNCVGVMQVERTQMERFDVIPVAVARMLGALYAAALATR